jgi:hypothetical protein
MAARTLAALVELMAATDGLVIARRASHRPGDTKGVQSRFAAARREAGLAIKAEQDTNQMIRDSRHYIPVATGGAA